MHMWSYIVTPYPMVMENIMVWFDMLVKSNYVLLRYLDPNVVYPNTMGFTVTMVDHMSFCSHGLSLLDINQPSRGQGMTKQPQVRV